MTIDATTGALNFRTSANARTITIGNTTTTTALAMSSGTGDVTIDPRGAVTGGTVFPGGDNLDSLGDDTHRWNTIYVNNIVGSGALGYWQRGTGILYPNTLTDGLAATTSATTVATFTATGSNDALRVGGNTNYHTVDVNGNLTFVNAGVATITGPTTGLTIDATTGAMNFGTSANARTITIGNVTTTTGLALNSGTGDIVLTSTDQVKLNSFKSRRRHNHRSPFIKVNS